MKGALFFFLAVFLCVWDHTGSVADTVDNHGVEQGRQPVTPEETFRRMDMVWSNGITWNEQEHAKNPKINVKPPEFMGAPNALGSRCGRKKSDGTYESFPAILHFSHSVTTYPPMPPMVYLSEFPSGKGYRYYSDRNLKLYTEILPKYPQATSGAKFIESQQRLVKYYEEAVSGGNRTEGGAKTIQMYRRLLQYAQKTLADAVAGRKLALPVYEEEEKDHSRFFDENGTPRPGILAASYNHSLDVQDKYARVYLTQQLDASGKPVSQTIIRNMRVKVNYGGKIGEKIEIMQSFTTHNFANGEVTQTYCL